MQPPRPVAASRLPGGEKGMIQRVVSWLVETERRLGAADSVSAVCRSSINQMVTPDAMRGRMSSVFSLVVTSGPRLGDVESGAVAGLAGPRVSVASGGLACIVGVVAVVAAFPALARFDADSALPADRLAA